MFNGAVNPYYIPAGYGTALFIGDPVIITGTANTAEVNFPGAHAQARFHNCQSDSVPQGVAPRKGSQAFTSQFAASPSRSGSTFLRTSA